MPQRHSIESVTSSYLASYLRKISHQPLLDCFSPGKNPQFSGIKLFQRISQFLMVLDKVVFYHQYFSLFILMNYSLVPRLSLLSGESLGTRLDELLTRLESQAVGCYWSHYFVGALGYADDIVLLGPSASALRMMHNTCSMIIQPFI